MMINIKVEVPDGEYCKDCDNHYIDRNWYRRCKLFGTYLEQYGEDVLKCDGCKKAEVKE